MCDGDSAEEQSILDIRGAVFYPLMEISYWLKLLVTLAVFPSIKTELKSWPNLGKNGLGTSYMVAQIVWKQGGERDLRGIRSVYTHEYIVVCESESQFSLS